MANLTDALLGEDRSTIEEIVGLMADSTPNDTNKILTQVTIVDNLLSAYIDKPLSANQGLVLKTAIDNITTMLSSDDTTLDEIQEIVNFIKLNKSTLDTLGISNIAGLQTALDAKINATDIGVTVQAYDANTAKSNIKNKFSTRQTVTQTVEASNTIPFNTTVDHIVTLGSSLNIIVGTLPTLDANEIQRGRIIITDTENVAGWTGFTWLGTIPTGMSGLGYFGYEIVGSTVYIVKASNA